VRPRYTLMVLQLVLLAACGRPPEVGESPTPQSPPATAPATSTVNPTAPGTAIPTVGPSGSPGFSEDFAQPCGGEPSDGELLALLRDEGLLDQGSGAEVAEGPLCAGDWQYAVVTVPDLDPLLVVTQGEPDNLELVTAGTDVCTPEVRIQAPPGIRSAAACGP
jgi:hypothetical protein